MKDTKFVKQRAHVKINTETGEMENCYIRLTLHREEFFCAYLRHWGDFKDREGMKMRVFVSCIMASRLSVFGEKEGNYFSVQDAVDDAVANIRGMSEQCARQHIKNLAKDNFIIKTSKRGRYYLNPKYGIKGTISDQTCMEMHEYVDGKKKDLLIDPNEFVYREVDGDMEKKGKDIKPNDKFEKRGAE